MNETVKSLLSALSFSNTALSHSKRAAVRLSAITFCLMPLLGLLISTPAPAQARKSEKSANPVYTISNFEVWAEAKDAVSAKRAALTDGKLVAFSQLLKRLTPYSTYQQHPKPTAAEITKMITSLSVRDERNSTTEYLANMDFQFSQKAVKQVLRNSGLSFWDRQAKQVILVPVVDQSLLEARAGEQKPQLSQEDWKTSWKTLDLAHALVPLKLKTRIANVDEAVLAALIQGDQQALAGLLEAYKTNNVVVALISAAQSTRKVRLTLVGQDGIGKIKYQKDHIVSGGDMLQAADLAAEVAQTMLDRRLKIMKMRGRTAQVAVRPVEQLPWQTELNPAAPVAGWQGDVGGSERVVMHVQFRGLRHWQSIRKRLIEVQGLDDLNIDKLSSRGADISCEFPGGASALRAAVGAKGLQMQQDAGTWILLDG